MAESPPEISALATNAAVWHSPGPCPEQEDRFIYHEFKDRNVRLMAVFDGHGGDCVSQYLAENFVTVVDQILHPGLDLEDYPTAISQAFDAINAKLKNKIVNGSLWLTGSTATMAVIKDDAAGADIFLANTGDSRSLVYVPGTGATPLVTKDHSPGEPTERARIIAAGGRVSGSKHPRVDGILATSRSFGDHKLHPSVIHTPDVTGPWRFDRVAAGTVYVICASDGLFDALNSETLLGEALKQSLACAEEECQTLRRLKTACRYRITDNVTAVLVKLL